MPDPSPMEMSQKIIEAAEQCLLRYGISKTTMEDVAREAGASRASVYRYFGGREGLVEEIVRRRALVFLEETHQRMDRFAAFTERAVEGIVEDVTRGVRDPLMQLVSIEPAGASSQIGRPLLYGELTYRLWEPILMDAQRTGELRDDIDPRELADWIAQLEILFMSQLASKALTEEELRYRVATFVVPGLVSSR